jgi:hypothetical protein
MLVLAAAVVLRDVLNVCLPSVLHLTKSGSQPACRDLQGAHRQIMGGVLKLLPHTL